MFSASCQSAPIFISCTSCKHASSTSHHGADKRLTQNNTICAHATVQLPHHCCYGLHAALTTINKTNGLKKLLQNAAAGWQNFQGDHVMEHWLVKNTAIGCHTVTEDWIIHFAEYTTAETPNAFHRPDTFPNCPFLWGSWHPSNKWFLGPTGVSPPNSISLVQPF